MPEGKRLRDGSATKVVTLPKAFRSLRRDFPRLRYVPGAALQIRRVRRGRGFGYWQSEREVRAKTVLDRIEGLVIPPAWEEVRICVHPQGHLQATGRDARGRKQYLYHPRWRRLRDEQKFARLRAFASVLPRIRRKVGQDLHQPGLSKSKALGAVVRLLEVSRIRVGNEEYARSNHSFGLTTLRDQHVVIRGRKMRFHYRGKSGKEHVVELTDAALARVVARCQDLPGQALFQYLDEQGRRHKISSTDVNRYLREISGANFTAKDFRTWAGTVLMARALQALQPFESPTEARRNVNEATRAVARRLGNTPAICRKSYIHPAIIGAYLSGGQRWARRAKSRKRNGVAGLRGLPAREIAVVRLLEDQRASGG